MGDALLSIVVTAYTTDRLQDIYELLDSIKAQTYGRIEVVFVAERSMGLFDKVQAYATDKQIANVAILFNKGKPGLSASRNIGIKQAQGDIIAFVDDDVVLVPGWAEEMVKPYADESVIGVTGPALPLWEHAGMDWFPEEFYWVLGCTAWSGWKETREIRNAWGMNMSFRREAFDKAGLFSHSCGLCNSSRKRWADPPSEDVDFSLRAKVGTGKRIVYQPDVVVRHKIHSYRLGLRFVAQRSYSVGFQRRMLKRFYPQANVHADFFADERGLLKRILLKLLPSTFFSVFLCPMKAYRRGRVTLTGLAFIVLGYFSFIILGGEYRLDPEGDGNS